MAVTYNDTPENVAYLAALLGFEPIVAKAWIRLEGQGTPNPTNPLNIRNSLEMIGQTSGGFAYFEDPFRGLYSAKMVITRNAPSYGYDRILASAWNRDPLLQAKNIERSSWAAGNYGSDWANGKPGSIYNYVEANSVLRINTAGIKVESNARITVPANVEVIDGIGKVVTKTTADVPNIYALGVTEDNFQSILWTDGQVRFLRTVYPTTPYDYTSEEALAASAAATKALNDKIDAAQGQ
jgi:hypothetical protein